MATRVQTTTIFPNQFQKFLFFGRFGFKRPGIKLANPFQLLWSGKKKGVILGFHVSFKVNPYFAPKLGSLGGNFPGEALGFGNRAPFGFPKIGIGGFGIKKGEAN